MNLLKPWEERTFPFLGQEIRLKIKAPSYDEAPDFLKRMAEYGMAAVEAKKARVAGDPTAGVGLFSHFDPAFVKATFEKCVKPAADQFVEGSDGESKPLVTGLDVYQIANSVLVLSVLNDVQSRAMLSDAEGKGSSSPSTSGVGTGEGVPDAGDSPATFTVTADGPAA